MEKKIDVRSSNGHKVACIIEEKNILKAIEIACKHELVIIDIRNTSNYQINYKKRRR